MLGRLDTSIEDKEQEEVEQQHLGFVGDEIWGDGGFDGWARVGIFENPGPVSSDIVFPIRLSGGLNTSIPPDGINRYRTSP